MSSTPVASLFEVPLAEFTAARNALSRKLRDAGDAEEAKRIAGLRKPSKALWLVNQLARRAPEELHALIEATLRIRNAQQKGLAGDEVRKAMREQRAALSSLTALADPALERRVHDTLQAAAMAEPEALREGRLEQEMEPAGFEALLASGVQALQHEPPKSAPKATAKVDDKKLERERAAADKEAAKLLAQVQSLEAAAAEAEKAAENARAAAGKADEEATKARDKVVAARARAAAAEAHASKLREQR